MIPPQLVGFKKQQRKYNKHADGNNFLQKFELPHVKRSAMDVAAQPVGRHHEHVFKKGNAPANKHHGKQT